MNAERFQIAVWLLMPIVSLFVLVLMIGARGAIFGLPLLVLLVLLIVAPIWYYQLRDPS